METSSTQRVYQVCTRRNAPPSPDRIMLWFLRFARGRGKWRPEPGLNLLTLQTKTHTINSKICCQKRGCTSKGGDSSPGTHPETSASSSRTHRCRGAQLRRGAFACLHHVSPCFRRLPAIKYGGPLWCLAFLIPWWPWSSVPGSWLVGLHFAVSICMFDSFLTYVSRLLL